MKRDPALSPLSRDHHQALFVAMRLKRAGEDDAGQARSTFHDFWQEHGRNHFRVEEEVLLPAYARYGDPSAEEVVRVLVEHVEIRRRAADLEGDEDVGTSKLNELGELLEAHVRHEERALFPLIEQALPDEELRELGRRIEAAERQG